MPPVPSLILALAALANPAGDDTPWAEVLGPAQGGWPAPLERLRWRTSLADARVEAVASERPLLVVLRCLPCKQCSKFDADVLEAPGALSELLRRFVTVRLTDAAALDLDLFPVEGYQDLDLSWWGWVLSPEGRVYSVFGGRDEVSDETRISLAALEATLARVLDHHSDPRRAGWDLEPPLAEPGDGPRTPRDLPGYAAWERGAEGEPRECIHCHQVAEILRQPSLDAGTFDKERDLAVWPFPENVGLTLERDHGLRVSAVEAGSPAEAAGLEPGDVLGAANGTRLFGQTDLRAVLHRAPHGVARVGLVWTRGEDVHEGTLALASGWRTTVLDWRMSVSQGNVGAPPGFFPLERRKDVRERLGLPRGTMAVEPFFGRAPTSPAWKAGVRGSDTIVAVDGASPDLAGRAFLVWFRKRYDPGDEVTLTLAGSDGARREVRFELGGR